LRKHQKSKKKSARNMRPGCPKRLVERAKDLDKGELKGKGNLREERPIKLGKWRFVARGKKRDKLDF